MANTYKWKIEALDCYPEQEGHTKVVFTVHWRLNADDGAGHKATVYGSVGVTYEAGAPFTAYADLTKDQVVGWVEAALGEEQVAQFKSNLDGQIQNQINPPVISPPVPWAA